MGFFDKLKKITTNLFSGFSEADEAFFEELEETLILADLGMDTALEAVEQLRQRVRKEKLRDQEEVKAALRDVLVEMMDVGDTALDISTQPSVVLFIGVNGVGKTTSIGKLGNQLKNEGKRVLFCAADTFRAAASEQLELWANRAEVPLVQAGQGADPAAVIFDAVKSATAKGYDMVIADTAGRLHNKKGLMDELAKISRSVKKASPEASLEVLLVLDAITGQNAISQAEEFVKAAGATGVVLTKLDGTPKGGCVISVWENLGLPIRFIGVGEQIDDLMEFDAESFVQSLLPGLPERDPQTKEETL